MLTIYHTPPSRSVRVVWLCEEMGLPYRTVTVPFGARPPKEFLAASPLGQLPAIEDGDVRMIESIAIMQYLMAKHGPTDLVAAPDEKDFAAYLQFLEFGESGLCAIGNAYVATRFRAPEGQRQNWTFDYVVAAMRARMKLVEKRLEDREFIAAERFTAADISVGWGIGIVKYFGIVETLSPPLEAYHQRMIARPAYIKASAEPAVAA